MERLTQAAAKQRVSDRVPTLPTLFSRQQLNLTLSRRHHLATIAACEVVWYNLFFHFFTLTLHTMAMPVEQSLHRDPALLYVPITGFQSCHF